MRRMTNLPKRSLLYKVTGFNLSLAALLFSTVAVYFLTETILGLMLGEVVTIILSLVFAFGVFIINIASLFVPLCNHLGVNLDD